MATTSSRNKTEEPSVKNTSPVTITFVGDIMLDRGVRRSVEKNFAGNYNVLFTHASYLKESDITFGNLEGPVAPQTIGRNVGSIFSFRMDPKGLEAMKTAGSDIVSFANNHVGDYSRGGFVETLKQLSSRGLVYTGAGINKESAYMPTVITVRGMTVGFLAATDVGPTWLKAGDGPGTIILNDPLFIEAVKKADKEVDILIISVHWGNEYSPVNLNQEKWAYKLIDNGADIIVGHHPHVVQRIETYKEKLIFYSLGNYIFDQYFSVQAMQGMVAIVSIDPETKAIKHSAFISPINKHFIPQPLVPFSVDSLISKPFYP